MMESARVCAVDSTATSVFVTTNVYTKCAKASTPNCTLNVQHLEVCNTNVHLIPPSVRQMQWRIQDIPEGAPTCRGLFGKSLLTIWKISM